jgi:hypothetical protein
MVKELSGVIPSLTALTAAGGSVLPCSISRFWKSLALHIAIDLKKVLVSKEYL